MEQIYLTSAKFVRDVMPVYDNISDTFLLSAIHEAQEMKLKAIVGADMLARLKSDTGRDCLTGAYARLLEESQYYLAYSAVALLLPKVQYKITNAGVVTTSDENVTPVDAAVLNQEITRYEYKADACAHDLQAWIIDHLAELPEISTTHGARLKANIISSATSGIWLGGARNPRRR